MAKKIEDRCKCGHLGRFHLEGGKCNVAGCNCERKFRVYFRQINQDTFEVSGRNRQDALFIAKNKWKERNLFPDIEVCPL